MVMKIKRNYLNCVKDNSSIVPWSCVMGIKRGAVGRKCPSWALSPLVLISVSLGYWSIEIVPYCLGATRGVSPMYLLYSAHGAQCKGSNEL